jgi:uncharacterized membrane protein
MVSEMNKDRLIAFTDGVIAVIITIMVLDMRAPPDVTITALRHSVPIFFSYVLSFVYVAIYWNNHHHFFHLVHRVSGGILWANLHLLFWLSLIPFATSWVGQNHTAAIPTALYGAALLLCAIAWYIMQIVIVRSQGSDSALARALGSDLKGRVSPLLYIGGIVLAFVDTLLSEALYVVVALMWLVPDRRIERSVRQSGRGSTAG